MKAACVVCGKEFTKHKGSVTCGFGCAIERRAALSVQRAAVIAKDKGQRRPNLFPPKPLQECVICRSRFHQHGLKKTCSQECRKTMAVMRSKEWSEKNPSKRRAATTKYRTNNPDRYRNNWLRWADRNREHLRAAGRARGQLIRAAARIGVPPIVLAVMKLRERLTRESANAD